MVFVFWVSFLALVRFLWDVYENKIIVATLEISSDIAESQTFLGVISKEMCLVSC